LSFSSVGCNIDRSVAGQSGVYTFRIRGELVHRIGSLLPDHGQSPKFSQIYIHDSNLENQAHFRMAHHHEYLDESILLALQRMLHDLNNPYVEVFLTAGERIRRNENISLNLATIQNSNLDHRRYNYPTAAEIAVIMPGTGEERTSHREIILQPRYGPLQLISELHSSYLPLRYPILFPRGEQGWHVNMPAKIEEVPHNK